MPTQKPRFSIAIDDDLLKAVDDYKFDNRIKSQNQAINDLVRAGLCELSRIEAEAIKKASEAETTAPEAKENPHIKMFADVLLRNGLIEDVGDLSDTDLEFLQAMLLALKAHFKDRKKCRD